MVITVLNGLLLVVIAPPDTICVDLRFLYKKQTRNIKLQIGF